MESSDAKQNSNTTTDPEENPTSNNDSNSNNTPNIDDAGNHRRRTPFTDLSQVDADLALARTLQEQERAYMMLRMDGSDYGSWEGGSFELGDEVEDDDYDDASEEDYDGSDVELVDDTADAYDENEDEEQNIEMDPSAFSSDEAYARALQDAEEREMAARLMALAGINEMVVGEEDVEEEHADNSQDVWEEVDPDELSYEELIALGEVVGTESRGLSAESIASLPSTNYKAQGNQDRSSDSCVICRLDYEDGDTLTVLSCKHSYHPECINNWLKINKNPEYTDNIQGLLDLKKDVWEEVDPDELSYEELIALGEVVGTESRGLSAESIASLPSTNYKAQGNQDRSSDSCVICRLDYEDGDTLTVLSCKHSYHPECINNWLKINKVCPVCSAEVSTSGKS